MEFHTPLVHPSLFAHPLASLVTVMAGLTFAFLPALEPWRRRLDRSLFASSPLAFRVALFVAAFVIYALVARLLFDGLPRLTDGIAAIFQSRIFARGAASLPLPPEAIFYESFGILGVKAGAERWAGMYPPGWPALLVPFVLLGKSWIANPFFGAALAVAVTALGEELHTPRVGRIAGLMTVLSPLVTILSATHLSHTSTALFACLSLWALQRMMRTASPTWGILSGLCWSVAFLCRPLTALVLGGVFAVGALLQWRRALLSWRGIVAGLLVAGLAAGTLALFQEATTGDPLVPGHKIGMGRRGKFGFVKLDHVRTHTPQTGARHTLLRLQALNTRLLGWPLPALLLVLAPFLLRRSRPVDWWLLASLGALLGIYAMYWYFEVYFPARYTFAAVPLWLVLAARGWTCSAQWIRGLRPGLAAVPTAVAAASVLFTVTVSNADYFAEHGPNFGDVESVLPKVLSAYSIENAVVFMDSIGGCSIRNVTGNDFYGTGFLRNDLDLDGGVIYARNLKEYNAALFPHFPGRSYYFYRYLRCEGTAMLWRIHPTEGGYRLEMLPPRIEEVKEGFPIEEIPFER